MKLNTLIKKFVTEDTGAITLEVLALGGVIVVLGVFAVAGVIRGVEDLDQAETHRVDPNDIISTF